MVSVVGDWEGVPRNAALLVLRAHCFEVVVRGDDGVLVLSKNGVYEAFELAPRLHRADATGTRQKV
jgi:hypothetical protein